MAINKLLDLQKPLIGMIHVGALPGTPRACNTLKSISATALQEAEIYYQNGFDCLLIENMHDLPYLRGRVGPEIIAALAVIADKVKSSYDLPTGLQILAGANIEAVAVAKAANLDFIRAEGYAFAHIADEGLIQACAGDLLRYRKQIEAESVQIWTDIKKKHASHSITSDIGLGEMAEAVEFMLGDAVIVTGSKTGHAPRIQEIVEVKKQTNLSIMIGSGITAENLKDFYHCADGFIVGSYCKYQGKWHNPLDIERVQLLVKEVRRLRNS